VTLVHNAGHLLNREDADAAEIIQRAFVREGIQLALDAKTRQVRVADQERVVVVERAGQVTDIPCDAVLVSAGRVPNLDGLALEAAGVAYEANGVRVNDRLQTSNPRIFAAGDVAAPFKFTHTANALGRLAMINALLWGRNRMSRLIVPWCTYTDPEIAHVGLYAHQATARGLKVKTLTVSLAENDRAILDGEDEGFVRVHLKAGSETILGATIVAAHAGDLLTYFTMAMTRGQGLSSLTAPIYPYPTQSEVLRKLAGMHLAGKLTPWIKRLLSRLVAWHR
jgi:pyruvate/2-oxoglutarate dehydrogenase complex dihydrolipoamide dehydrogenase (E3) component